MPEPAQSDIGVVGLIGGACFGSDARATIDESTVVVGSERQLDLAGLSTHAERLILDSAIDPALEVIAQRRRDGKRVCVLASGDPGFFGIVRLLGDRFGPAALRIHPAPSAISLAFARLGYSWDDAVVVSAHGRPLDQAVARVLATDKVAVLTSPDNPPEALGAALVAAGCGPRHVAVVTRIGGADEATFEGDLPALASGAFDPMSVVILRAPDPTSTEKSLAWGLSENQFAHRRGMITKAEVRAVVLGKLDLPRTGVLWDVGAGSGSVAIEAARLCPALQVFAVDHDADSVARITRNALAHAVSIEVVHGTAPAALAELPDPDRVFVGGGGIEALDAALAHLRPKGVIVANYALMDRAVAGWHRLGNMAELSVARGVATSELGVRLAAENPVFVCWGPAHDDVPDIQPCSEQEPP